MKLAFAQLEAHLKKNLAPVYLISGDEILLVQEGLDRIRQAAREKGFSERISLNIEANTDWGKIVFAETQSLSLFSNQKIVELHLPNAKPNAQNTKILQEILSKLSEDTLLLISTGKLDSKTEQNAWYKAIDKQGICIPVWPIEFAQLPAWIMLKAKSLKLTILPEAAKRLAELTEGNLLATKQEIEKFSLLNLKQTIDLELIESLAADNARYDIFGLVDAALAAQTKRSLHMLSNLKAEDAEPILILWALTRELRNMADLIKAIQAGGNLSSLFKQFRIWEKRQGPVRQFIQNHTLRSVYQLLSDAAQIDRQIKGVAQGDPWQSLENLVIHMNQSAIMAGSL